MKLPFHIIISPILKPYFGHTKLFCQHPTFSASIFYTYFYGVVGLCLSVHNLKLHLGKMPLDTSGTSVPSFSRDAMLVHDLQIIATSLGLIQYACLILGCFTENPGLFLPHLAGQIVAVILKIINVSLLVANMNMKSLGKLRDKVASIVVMTFNWLQEFCVFRQYLCVCDL
ncbi:unnamed protein product [Colias eurytheme]|nr:unnamed protein product [Colias eurytheme]